VAALVVRKQYTKIPRTPLLRIWAKVIFTGRSMPDDSADRPGVQIVNPLGRNGAELRTSWV